MTLGVYSGCLWILFVVFHHWPIDTYKASPGSCRYCISTLSEPPELSICDFDGQLRISGLSRAVMPWTWSLWSLWWALISQRLSGHILLRGEHGCSRDRALEWTQKTHDHWCVSILESMESWHNITPSAIQSENDVSCAWLWNETQFGGIHLNFPWHNLLSHFYLNTNVFCLHRTTCCFCRTV